MSELLEEKPMGYSEYYASYVVPSRELIPDITPPYNFPEPLKKHEKKVKINLSLFNKFWLVFSVIMSMALLGLSIIYRMNVKEQEKSMVHLEQQIQAYHIHTEELRSEMSSQYNFQSIKEIVERDGMTIDKARIGKLQR